MSKKHEASAACSKECDSAAGPMKPPTVTRQTVTQKKLRFQNNLNPTGLSFTLFSLSIARCI
jgi:hypothetical protein